MEHDFLFAFFCILLKTDVLILFSIELYVLKTLRKILTIRAQTICLKSRVLGKIVIERFGLVDMQVNSHMYLLLIREMEHIFQFTFFALF